MGKFDGVLLVSDYDNTLVYTQSIFDGGGAVPPIPPYNLQRLRYFTENGGRFTLVSGRTWALVEHLLPGLPINAPVGIGNGAGLIDPATGAYLYQHTLPERVTADMEAILAAFPALSCEIYCADHTCYAIRPCPFTYRHASYSGYTFTVVEDLRQCPQPLLKILFEGENREELVRVADFISAQSWAGAYELIFSKDTLLEFAAKGAVKGNLVRKLAELCGVSMEHVYCIGDQENDLTMLQAAKEGFCPADAAEVVLRAGATVLRPCQEGAVGELVDRLDALY